MNSPQEYDAIIIGSGQGGNPLAHTLADRGWRVALIERHHLGGSCINYGCTPSKAMLASAHVAQTARDAAPFGVNTGPVSVDLARVIQRKNEIVRRWRDGQHEHVDSRPTLDLYRGEGSFVGGRTVRVNGTELRASHIFIDTGSSPRIPDLPGLHQVPYHTNLTIMDLAELPRHLLIMGGSYLGLEFGQMFRRFGSQVTIVEHAPQIISREEGAVAQELQSALEAEGIAFCLDAAVSAVAQDGSDVVLTVETSDGCASELRGSHLLVAVGRVPNTPALNLSAAGVETDEHGYIRVNERLETTAPGIWALGDVKGGPAFTHVSFDDHLIILDHLFGDGTRTTRDRIIPYALYTDPELGRVGLDEIRAREAGYRLKVGSIPVSNVARAVESGKTSGLMTVVIDADTDLVLGATVLGLGGGELAQHFATLMRANVPYTVMKRAIYTHPTMTEGFYGLMESVHLVESSGG